MQIKRRGGRLIMENKYVIVNGREIPFSEEKNLLEVIRKANVNIPTFCYHSELSTYGACRLCIVDIAGRGINTSCSIKPEHGMSLRTHTKELRDIRKITMELFLANHRQDCAVCSKSTSCKLKELAADLGVAEVRFKKTTVEKAVDFSSKAIVRDPNKCILCGDCVRACTEIQSVGAIDFTHRGSEVTVEPAFGKNLAEVECIDCGQCARVCPTGSLTPKPDIAQVWKELDNPDKYVVASIAPAVRVALGEMFGFKPGENVTGQIVSALRLMGFRKVYDTAFTADLTVIEETDEFIGRLKAGKKGPMFTSCCPGWVKFAEQYYPGYLDNLSTCKSPQQMMGAVVKNQLPGELGKKPSDVIMVSIMPCTAKKVEADRPEFKNDGVKEVDYVITTQELARMIKEAGISFADLNPDSLDHPFGFKTGAGLLFGNSGGVSEAVLRYASEVLNNRTLDNHEFTELRGNNAVRKAKLHLNGFEIKLAVVSGLANARDLITGIENGTEEFDLIEVMACPGGCIGGAGQPFTCDDEIRQKRARGIYNSDKTIQLHKSQENPFINKLYAEKLGEAGGKVAHNLLHTHYKNRKRLFESEISFIEGTGTETVDVNVCIGTNCFIKGSQNLLRKLVNYVEDKELADIVEVKATFCMEECNKGKNVTVDGEVISAADFSVVTEAIEKRVARIISVPEIEK